MENLSALRGYLMKEKSKTGLLHGLTGDINKRYFKVQRIEASDELALCYYKNIEDPHIRGWIYLKDVTQIAEDKDTMTVSSVARTLHLYAQTRAEHNRWVTGLAKLCPDAFVKLERNAPLLKKKGSDVQPLPTRALPLATKKSTSFLRDEDETDLNGNANYRICEDDDEAVAADPQTMTGSMDGDGGSRSTSGGVQKRTIGNNEKRPINRYRKRTSASDGGKREHGDYEGNCSKKRGSQSQAENSMHGTGGYDDEGAKPRERRHHKKSSKTDNPEDVFTVGGRGSHKESNITDGMPDESSSGLKLDRGMCDNLIERRMRNKSDSQSDAEDNLPTQSVARASSNSRMSVSSSDYSVGEGTGVDDVQHQSSTEQANSDDASDDDRTRDTHGLTDGEEYTGGKSGQDRSQSSQSRTATPAKDVGDDHESAEALAQADDTGQREGGPCTLDDESTINLDDSHELGHSFEVEEMEDAPGSRDEEMPSVSAIVAEEHKYSNQDEEMELDQRAEFAMSKPSLELTWDGPRRGSSATSRLHRHISNTDVKEGGCDEDALPPPKEFLISQQPKDLGLTGRRKQDRGSTSCPTRSEAKGVDVGASLRSALKGRRRSAADLEWGDGAKPQGPRRLEDKLAASVKNGPVDLSDSEDDDGGSDLDLEVEKQRRRASAAVQALEAAAKEADKRGQEARPRAGRRGDDSIGLVRRKSYGGSEIPVPASAPRHGSSGKKRRGRGNPPQGMAPPKMVPPSHAKPPTTTRRMDSDENFVLDDWDE